MESAKILAATRAIIGERYEGGLGREEVRKMVAPTCSTCGSIPSGYEQIKELNTFVYFCPQCRVEEEKVVRLKAREEVAKVGVLREAA